MLVPMDIERNQFWLFDGLAAKYGEEDNPHSHNYTHSSEIISKITLEKFLSFVTDEAVACSFAFYVAL